MIESLLKTRPHNLDKVKVKCADGTSLGGDDGGSHKQFNHNSGKTTPGKRRTGNSCMFAKLSRATENENIEIFDRNVFRSFSDHVLKMLEASRCRGCCWQLCCGRPPRKVTSIKIGPKLNVVCFFWWIREESNTRTLSKQAPIRGRGARVEAWLRARISRL